MPGFHIAGIDVAAARGCIFGLFTFTLQTEVSAGGGCGYQMRALQPFDVQIPLLLHCKSACWHFEPPK